MVCRHKFRQDTQTQKKYETTRYQGIYTESQRMYLFECSTTQIYKLLQYKNQEEILLVLQVSLISYSVCVCNSWLRCTKNGDKLQLAPWAIDSQILLQRNRKMEPPFQFLVSSTGIKLTFTLVSEMYPCVDGSEKTGLTQLSEVLISVDIWTK